MPSVEMLCVNTIQLTHALRKICIRTVDNKVVMIIHQHVAMNDPLKARHDGVNDVKENSAVFVIHENSFIAISLAGYVVVSAGKLYANWSGHKLKTSCEQIYY